MHQWFLDEDHVEIRLFRSSGAGNCKPGFGQLVSKKVSTLPRDLRVVCRGIAWRLYLLSNASFRNVTGEHMKGDSHWVGQVATAVEEHVRRTKSEQALIVCASGISPSGPIHLGNLREVMTVHFVCEELIRRGRKVRHIHSWDDFDRLRKIPEGLDESFARYIGQPLCDVPDPRGEYESYAHRHMTEFATAVERLQIHPEYIRQSVAYRRGDYNAEIKTALAARHQLFDILAAFQTPGRNERPLEERRQEYWPFRVYCESCGKDTTEIRDYAPATSEIHYACSNCGHAGAFFLDQKVPGKLVWKVDWPMRWGKETVDFEPGGEDHSSPMSSAAVGRRVIREVYGKEPPYYVGYAFVGMAGRSKISSSAGTSAVPSTALQIFEPSLLRWQYFRRAVGQKFDVFFGAEVVRLYDEWDSLRRRAEADPANEKDRFVLANCLETSAGPVECSQLTVPFRILSSAADITQGNVEQILRIVGDHLENPPAPDALAAVDRTAIELCHAVGQRLRARGRADQDPRRLRPGVRPDREPRSAPGDSPAARRAG